MCVCVCVCVCVLLTDLAAVSKCLELSTVAHTALLTPATIEAAAVFWRKANLSLLTPVYVGTDSFKLL